jgi:Family of unknown function (DUF6151)
MTGSARDIPLRCRCGHVRGIASEVAPYGGFRFICYCQDCQTFARLLERQDVLDSGGGTDIFQMPTGRMKLTAGKDALRCLQFSRQVFRWYTDCCRTPIGNTAGPRFPMIGVIHSLMRHDADGRSRDEALGAPLCRIFERSATAPLPPNVPAPVSLSQLALRGSKLLSWWLRGLGRPNPFFDERTGAPRSAPRILTPSERAALVDTPVHCRPTPR